MPEPISKKEQDFVNKWNDSIKLGQEYKDKYSDWKAWKDYRNWFRGDFGDACKDQYNVNRTFSYLRSAVPRVYFRTPSISVTSRRPEMAPHARVVETIDNWLVQETKLKKTLKTGILNAFLTGIGVVKLGFDSEFGFIPEQQVGENQSTVTQFGKDSGSKIEYNVNINPGMPWADSTLPEDIVTPWGYVNYDSLPWIAHRIVRPLEDVKEDQKYFKVARGQLKGGFSITNHDNKVTASLQDKTKDNYCLLWEIRDYKEKRMYVICEDRLLLDVEDSLQIDGSTYEFIVFNEDPDRFWPISDVKMFAPQQLEINEIRQYARKMRKAYLLKFLFTKGALSPENLKLLLSDDIDDALCGIEINAESIAQAVQTFTPNSEITNSLIRELQQVDADFRETMGFSQNQTGEFVPFHNKTATEASIVQEGSAIRTDERRDIIADVLSNIVRKFNQYIFTFWDKERIVEIIGVDGLRYWVSYTGAQLRGEYNLLINPETGQPVTRALRQQVAQNMFQLFNQDPLIDQIGLRRLVMQQTDLIDPGYQNLVRLDPTQINQMGVTPQSPIGLEDLSKDASLRSKITG